MLYHAARATELVLKIPPALNNMIAVQDFALRKQTDEILFLCLVPRVYRSVTTQYIAIMENAFW